METINIAPTAPRVKTSQFIANNKKLTTDELAFALRVFPQTIRAGLCRNGHYLGLRPTKLPSGRLLWDVAEVERLLAGEAA